MPLYEIAQWTASDELQESKSILKPALEDMNAVDGFISVYIGLGEEEKKTAILFVGWESYEHHQALINDKEKYPIIIGKLKPAVGEGPFSMIHAEFNKDPTAALNAPATEILSMTLKDGKTKEDLYSIATIISSMVELDKGSYAPVVWGPTIEDKNKYWLLLGWESVQTHYDVIGQEKYKEHLKTLGETVDIKMIHSKLVNGKDLP